MPWPSGQEHFSDVSIKAWKHAYHHLYPYTWTYRPNWTCRPNLPLIRKHARWWRTLLNIGPRAAMCIFVYCTIMLTNRNKLHIGSNDAIWPTTIELCNMYYFQCTRGPKTSDLHFLICTFESQVSKTENRIIWFDIELFCIAKSYKILNSSMKFPSIHPSIAPWAQRPQVPNVPSLPH